MPSLRALIVEDSQIILDNLVPTLEELAEVRVVGAVPDEAGARRWINESGRDFDLLIIDVFLRSGNGMGVLRAVREAGLSAFLIVLTNYATPDIRQRCRELGADRVFDKSSELDDLIAYCARLGRGEATRPGALS